MTDKNNTVTQKWTPSARHCYASGQDCSRCSAALILEDFNRYTRCKMPETLVTLLAEYGPPPLRQIEREQRCLQCGKAFYSTNVQPTCGQHCGQAYALREKAKAPV